MITFILALYAAILSTFLFGRWVRMVIIRRRVRQSILKEEANQTPLTPYRQATLDIQEVVGKTKEELEGEVVSAFEMELEKSERDETEESVEEREWREEENIRLRYQRR